MLDLGEGVHEMVCFSENIKHLNRNWLIMNLVCVGITLAPGTALILMKILVFFQHKLGL